MPGIDCQYFYAPPQGNFGLWRSVALSSGLSADSPLFFAYIEGQHGNITSQIAVQLALHGLRRGVLETEPGESSGARQVVQSALREANRDVFLYGQKMLSGGKVAAAGLVAAFDGENFCIGRAGSYGCYLWRAGKLVPIYTDNPEGRDVLGRLIGVNKQLTFDLATIRPECADRIVMTTIPRSAELDQEFLALIESDLTGAAQLGTGIREIESRHGERIQGYNMAAIWFEFSPGAILLEEVVEEVQDA